MSGKPVGTLTNAIWQFPFRNLEEVIKKMNRYSSLGAPKLAGKRVSMASALGHGRGRSSSITFSSSASSTAGPASSSRFGNFEGTFYRYAKRYEETQDWQPPQSEPIKRKP